MSVVTCKRKKDKEDKMTERMTKKLTAKEKQHRGELYLPGDEEVMEGQLRCLEKLYDFNQTRPLEQEKREATELQNCSRKTPTKPLH